MTLRCPYCAEKITSAQIQCPACGTPYDLVIILLISSLARQTFSVDFNEQKKYAQVLSREVVAMDSSIL